MGLHNNSNGCSNALQHSYDSSYYFSKFPNETAVQNTLRFTEMKLNRKLNHDDHRERESN